MDNPNVLLKYAVNEIVQDIKNGAEPQAALSKVSKELDLNANFIKRASEAINVALHYDHFKKNAEARADDFPITDASQVVKEVFGKTEKTASELKSEWFPKNEYADEAFNFNQVLTSPKHKVAYEQIMKAAQADAHESYSMTTKGVFEKSAKYIDDLTQTAEDLKTEKVGTEIEATQLFSKIVREFSKDAAARVSFEEFESQAFSEHGQEALPYVDLVYKTAGMDEPRGVHDDKYKMFDSSHINNLFSTFLDKASSLRSLTKASEDADYNLNYEKEALRESYHHLGKAKMGSDVSSLLADIREQHKFAESDVDPVLEAAKKKIHDNDAKLHAETAKLNDKEEVLHDSAKPEDEKTDKELHKDIAELHTEEEVGHDKAEKLEAKEAGDDQKKSKDWGPLNPVVDILKKNSPSGMPAERGVDKLDRKLMLQELITTDPIISKMKPEHVVESYNQMQRLAPELAKEKEIVRSTLRQLGSSQALGSFEASQLTDANTGLLKQRMMESGLLQPKI